MKLVRLTTGAEPIGHNVTAEGSLVELKQHQGTSCEVKISTLKLSKTWWLHY